MGAPQSKTEIIKSSFGYIATNNPGNYYNTHAAPEMPMLGVNYNVTTLVNNYDGDWNHDPSNHRHRFNLHIQTIEQETPTGKIIPAGLPVGLDPSWDGTGNTLSVGMKGSDGVIYNESNSATGATFGNADVISVALDMDNRKAYFAVNGTWVNSGNPATAANPILWYTQRADGTPWTDVITMGITGNSNTYPRCNFGGYSSVVPSSPQSDSSGYGTFEYTPPSGYYALCTKNLEEFG